MKLIFEITKQDYIDFNIFHMKYSTTVRRRLLAQRFIIPVIYMILPFFLIKITKIPLWYWICSVTILSIAWIIFYPSRFKRRLEKLVQKMLDEGKTKGILGEHRLVITENEIVDATKYSETKYSMIEDVIESENHIFIYVSALSACIIPKNVFQNVKEKNELINALEKFRV